MQLYHLNNGSYVCEHCATASDRAIYVELDCDSVRADLAQEALEDLRHAGDAGGLTFTSVYAETFPRCARCDLSVTE